MEFDPYSNSDIARTFSLPTVGQLVTEYFKDYGYILERTEKSSIVDRILALADGTDLIETITDKRVFDLLVKLTPKRIEHIVRTISKAVSEKAAIRN